MDKIKFSKILVTGPQRSGTRIVAKIIAFDNKIRYVDEQEFDVRDMISLGKLFREDGRMVIQCPALCYCLHDFHYLFNLQDLLVVMVIRDIKDIINSQSNIKWTQDKKRTWARYERRELEHYGRKEGIISEVKYKYWQKQKSQIPNWLEIKYDDLKNHQLFIPKERRENFTWDQTEEVI